MLHSRSPECTLCIWMLWFYVSLKQLFKPLRIKRRDSTTGAGAEHMRHVGRRAEPHIVLKYAESIKETGGKMTKMEILPSEHCHPAARCLISHKNQREETFFGGVCWAFVHYVLVFWRESGKNDTDKDNSRKVVEQLASWKQRWAKVTPKSHPQHPGKCWGAFSIWYPSKTP